MNISRRTIGIAALAAAAAWVPFVISRAAHLDLTNPK